MIVISHMIRICDNHRRIAREALFPGLEESAVAIDKEITSSQLVVRIWSLTHGIDYIAGPGLHTAASRSSRSTQRLE